MVADEIRSKAKKLRAGIAELIYDFEEETGCSITAIYIDSVEVDAGASQTGTSLKSFVDLELEVQVRG